MRFSPKQTWRTNQIRYFLSALLITILPVSARVLPNIDAYGDAPVVVSSAKAKILQYAETIATAHIEERLGVPTFLALRPGAAVLAQGVTRGLSAESAARAHLKSFADLYQISATEIDAAPLHHIEQVFNGATLAKFTNQKDGIEIFRESVTVLMKSSGEASAISGSIGAAANVSVISSSPATPFRLAAEQAVATALGDYEFDASIASLLVRANVPHDSADPKVANYKHFLLPADAPSDIAASMSEPARTKPVWFRTPAGLIPAHYVELQMTDGDNVDYYSYVIAADDGRILFRNNQTSDAAFTYKVWADATGINIPQTGPQGRNATPHPTGLNDGYQPPFVLQSQVTLQNGPISTADPWLPADATRTIGNNVEAWANHFAPPLPASDGFEGGANECTTTPGTDFHACISSASTFAYTFDPEVAPKIATAQSAAAVVNLFYVTNWLHDWYYDAGFREIDGNAQNDNFGRGGVGGDSMKAQAQDNAGINNANMSVPADGGRPRMRTYLFTGNEAAALVDTSAGVNYPVGVAAFGPAEFTAFGPLTLVNDGFETLGDGCQPLLYSVGMQIAVIDRGYCTFKLKALNAQNNGASAVIIVNNVSGVLDMADDSGIVTPITIPTVMVSPEVGAALKSLLPSDHVIRLIKRFRGVDRDGAIDNSIIAHEWGHFISNRLIGNANGLATMQARGLGEGWSDFHALLMMARPEDALVPGNPNFTGVYTIGGYVQDRPLIPGATQSRAHYDGLRRYPYSSNLSKNPLTFKHIQTYQLLPTNPPPRFTGDNAESHATGEVWASMLWGCYSSLLRDTPRLSFAQAQDRMKRYLVTAYKLTPINPTLIEARDALYAAIAANDTADLAPCMAAFAQRGAGVLATSGNRYDENNAGVKESFATGNDLSITNLTLGVVPITGCDNDPYLDLGETGLITVTVQNTGAATLSGATMSLDLSDSVFGFPDGPSLTLPTLAPFASTTVTKTIRLTQDVPINALIFVTATVSHPSLASATVRGANLQIAASRDATATGSATDDFEASTTRWTTSLSAGAGIEQNWRRVPISNSNKVWIAPGGETAGIAWLTSPPIKLAPSGTVGIVFKHRYAFESNGTTYFDGGVIEVSTDGGASWVDIGNGPGASLLYAGNISNTVGTANPLAGRPAVVGTSIGYPEFGLGSVFLPPNYFGKTVIFRFAAASGNGGHYAGWEIDDVNILGAVTLPFAGYATDAYACVSLAPSTGNAQSAPVNTAFTSPLQIRVMGGDGLPVSGAVIDFVAPASGASATFFGGTANSTSVTTDINGYATTPQLNANGISGNYNVTANIGARTTSFILTNFQAGGLISVVSRKFHSGPTPFDIDINLSGLPVVEPREIGNGHMVIFHFNNTINSVAGVSVVDSVSNTVTATATPSGNDVIVIIPSLADNKRITIALTGVMGPTGNVNPQPVSMGFLVGDFNSSRTVNASDINSVKAQSGQATVLSNFRFDVNASGTISSTDISAVKARSGLVLP